MKWQLPRLEDLVGAVRGARDAMSDRTALLLDEARVRGSALNRTYRLSERADTTLDFAADFIEIAESTYGTIRQRLRPLPPADCPEWLVRRTEEELHYIIACVLQISPRNASKWAERFGNALSSKLAAAGVTTSLLGLVSAFGTAGTGAAISSLSGAAATSATMAWVGALIGGGMVAGTFLTAGVGLGVGYATYHVIGSRRRSFEELSDVDKGVIETCGVLAEAMRQHLAQLGSKGLTVVEIEMLHRNSLRPLYENLLSNTDDICSRLDRKNAIAFRQHAVPDFKAVAIDGYSDFLSKSERRTRNRSTNRIEYVIGGVVWALLSRDPVGQGAESQLVLDAVRRSTTDLTDASESVISDYLAKYSPEQLKGIANNVKGIYHELLFVDDFNVTHSDSYAELYEAANHAAADVMIKDRETGAILHQIQLKATDSAAYVREHLARYPEIEVRATEEVSLTTPGLVSTGISEEEIRSQVDSDLQLLADNSIEDQTLESGGLFGVVAAGRAMIEVSQGKKTATQAAKDTGAATATAAAATWIAAFLFS